ncbi:hypothetical protein [Azonexus sp.]|uniref:hypothetical protein n=1 Tax=Azonexus sp. TaxID=1872668 RepID=UPI0039E54120
MNSHGLAHIRAREDKLVADEQRRQKLLPVARALRDPDVAAVIIKEARVQVQKWRDKKLCSPCYIESWESLLDSPELAAKILEDKSKNANQMRQNSPFVSAVRRYAA